MEQLLQVVDLFTQSFTCVGIGNQHAVGRHLDNLGSGLDVCPTKYGVLFRSKRLMLY